MDERQLRNVLDDVAEPRRLCVAVRVRRFIEAIAVRPQREGGHGRIRRLPHGGGDEW